MFSLVGNMKRRTSTLPKTTTDAQSHSSSCASTLDSTVASGGGQDHPLKIHSRKLPFCKPLMTILLVLILVVANITGVVVFIMRKKIMKNIEVKAHDSMANYGMPITRNHYAPSYASYVKCLEDPDCTRFGPKLNQTYLHDYPGHPWHWTRENGEPSPDDEMGQKKDCKGSLYRDLYHQFHQDGFALFESCSLKHHPAKLLDQVAEYTASITVPRIHTAKNRAVKALAVDPDTLEFLEYLHGGRRLFPYQTLNFPKGTQQPLHSDLIHFDTSPRTLMTAAWVALEDMSPTNGPLQYVPGSHRFGTWDYDEIGLHDRVLKQTFPNETLPFYTGEEGAFYGEELHRLTKQAGLGLQVADTVKKGQTFVWAAGLVHGGTLQKNMEETRLSQVSHYFFEGSDFYWHPRLSNLAKGHVAYINDEAGSIRLHRCASTPDFVQLEPRITSCADVNIQNWLENCYDVSYQGLVVEECAPMKTY